MISHPAKLMHVAGLEVGVVVVVDWEGIVAQFEREEGVEDSISLRTWSSNALVE